MQTHPPTLLICDARLPLCGGGTLREELLLYNIPSGSIPLLIQEFDSATGKRLLPDSNVDILSGGQKVMLMCLCALFSPASAISFCHLWHSLDPHNRDWAKDLIASLKGGREILISGDSHAD